MTNEPENPAPAPTPQAPAPAEEPAPAPVPTFQAPTPAEQPAPPRRRKPARRRKWWPLVGAIWDSVCDWGCTPLNEYFKAEWPNIKKVPDLFLIIAVLGLLAGLWLRGCGVDRHYGFLNGKLSAQQDENRRLEKQIEDKNQEIIKNTIDSNEVKREKDAEILNIAEERNTAKQQLSYFETHSPQLLNLLATSAGCMG